jgi:hypothetical protein
MLRKENSANSTIEPRETMEAYWMRRYAEQAIADTQNMVDALFINHMISFPEYVLRTLDLMIAYDSLEVR